MRNLIKIATVVLFVMIVGFANGQSPKFGHIDLQALIQVMPERATAETDFNKFQDELEGLLTTMQTDLQNMFQEFEKLPETTSELVKNAKAQEIQDKQQRIQNFSTSANQQLQQKQSELFAPILEKAKIAIEGVAKEQGLIYVFDISGTQMGVVLYKSNESKDILPQVKVKLGIQ